MKARVEKRLIRARKELERINEQINAYEKQISNLKNLVQQQLNKFVGKQGGVVELENMLAEMAIQEKEVSLTDRPGKNKNKNKDPKG